MIVIAGPCQHENLEHSLNIAKHCNDICSKYGIEYIFKASYDKANRTSSISPRGLGLQKCKNDFDYIRSKYKLTTDYHEINHIPQLESDVYQIPAFLSKQTDLIQAAESTNKIVNIKKGQFMSPFQIKGILSKFNSTEKLWLTERGTSFGYDKVIIDFEGVQYIKDNFNIPIFLDITHSISERKYTKTMAKIAGVLGLNLFIEVHPDPDNAPSDGKKMLKLKDFDNIIKTYYDSRKSLG